MKKMQFEFSDTIAGYVSKFDKDTSSFDLKTTDGRVFTVKLTPNTFARGARNLEEPYSDCTGIMHDMLKEGQYLFAYGIFYPEAGEHTFEAKVLDFPGKSKDKYRFEESNWWINQAEKIAQFFIKSQFGGPDNIDYVNYRTSISLTGQHKGDIRQETDTISRLVYGFSSAYLLTGKDEFLEAAEAGTAYLRKHMRFYDVDENIVYWYHGVDKTEDQEHKVFASEFGDDYDAIPMYEQIYALAGPTQTYRITGDPDIMNDIELTVELFERFFKDKEGEGYFSHIDPITLDPRSESLGENKGRKNWNSVGDHAPAYLINLYLATKDEKYKDFLVYTADSITSHFPDYENSPFVNERFFEDWSHDLKWGWQQNQAVVGHNLKIAWNLMRINNAVAKQSYVDLAKKIAEVMPDCGMDKQRGGWYDVMDRKLDKGQEHHRFAWHDRKAWWQQEQGILAYQILYGVLKDDQHLKYARESASFYNAFFLDHDDGGVYFNVLNNGIPFLMGTERLKGSHSMSGYHSIELAYLSAVYTNLLNTKKPLTLHFKPIPGGFKDNLLHVQPDILPEGSVRISEVTMDDKPYTDYDAKTLTVRLPAGLKHRPKIQVKIEPV